MDSESLTGSYHTYCASDNTELTYLKRIHILRWTRFGLSFIILGAAVAVIGCEAVPLRHYQKTSDYERVWLSLWPLNFDLRPTIALLSCGCVIALLNLVYIVVALLPSPHPNIRLLNILAIVTALSGFITALVGFLFTIYSPFSTYPSGFSYSETLHSWTCKLKSLRGKTEDQNIHIQAPIHFARDCTETTAAFVLLGVLIGLEIIMGIAAVVGFLLERNVQRQRKYSRYDFVNVAFRTKNAGV